METCALRTLFPVPPQFDFQPRLSACACGGKLKAYKTAKRTVVTLHVGTFHAHLKYRVCDRCGQVLKPDELDRLVAPRCKFGFDVIEYVGRARFEHCLSQQVVQAALARRHVAISLREIDVLGRQFIVYLSQAHRDSQAALEYLRSFGLFGLWQLWQSSGPTASLKLRPSVTSSHLTGSPDSPQLWHFQPIESGSQLSRPGLDESSPHSGHNRERQPHRRVCCCVHSCRP